MKLKRNLLKNNEAVTLISLIITIIVMLILAGVSISLVVGDNGVLTQAQTSKLKQEDAAWLENAQMILQGASIDKKNLEKLNSTQEADAGSDAAKIEAYKKENIKAFLKPKFEAYDNSTPVMIGQSGEGFIIVQGERMIITKANLEMLSSSIDNNYKIAKAGDWLFEVVDGKARLTVCNLDLQGEVAIPTVVIDKDTGEVYEVGELGDGLFSYRTGITKIDFSGVSGKLTKIGATTFLNCVNLDITVPTDLPTSIVSIGDKAFYGCTNLKGNINEMISSGITLGKGVFMKCSEITGDIQEVFNQNFYIENGVPVATVIGESQFSGYSGLTGTLTIPNYITSIGNNAFYGCSSISGLEFEETSTCTSIGEYAFYKCTGISNNLNLPNSITTIGMYAFTESGITGLTLPNAVTNIGSYAFDNCKSLTGEIRFPATLSKTPEYGFQQTAITSIYFESNEITTAEGTKKIGIEEIGRYSFYRCVSLVNISCSETTTENPLSFPNTLKIISERAFAGDDKLTKMYFPNMLKKIMGYAFNSCTQLTVEKWSTGLAYLGGSTFYGCNSLETLPDTTSLVTLNGREFDGASDLGKTAIGGKTDIIAWLQNSIITSVGSKTFINCFYLSGEYSGEIYNSLGQKINIDGSAFTGTNVTKSGTISETVTEIKANEFEGTTNLSNVTIVGNDKVLTIPNTVTKIGKEAFKGSTAFNKLIIPNSVIEIGDHAFSNCANLQTVEFEENSKITKINTHLFSSSALNNISIPNSVTVIGPYAFFLTKLQSIIIPSSVTNIENYAFSWCHELKIIKLNDGLLTIGDSAFRSTACNELVIPNTVTSLGNEMILDNYGLKKITFGKEITKIPNSVCEVLGTSGMLTEVVINGNITEIGNNAFGKQTKLTTITGLKWENLTSIGTKAFYNCSSLKGNITLNRGCTLFDDTFENCPLVVSR